MEGQGNSSLNMAVGGSGASSSGVQDPCELDLTAIHSSQLEMRRLREEMRAAIMRSLLKDSHRRKKKSRITF